MEKRKQIKKVIKNVADRISLINTFYYLGVALIFGLIAGLIVTLTAMIFPVIYEKTYVILIVSVAAITALIIALIKREKMENAALKLDKEADLKERVTTAYELIDKDDEIANAVISSAFSHIQNINIKKLFPVKINIKKIGIIVLLLSLIVGLSMIDTPSRKEAKNKEEIAKIINEKKDVIKELKKEIKNNKELTDEEKKRLNEQLETALNEFKKADTKEELAKAEEKMLKKLEQEASNIDKNEELFKSLAKAAVDLNNNLSDKEKEIAKENVVKKIDDAKKAEEELNKALDEA
nr:hypothetical protein [Lachnospiraceae bacterium]